MRVEPLRFAVLALALTVGTAGVSPSPAAGAEMSAAGPPLETVEANHRTFFPEGDGPFPTVVAVPGCSGVSLDGPATDAGRPGDEGDRLFRRHYRRMADRLSEHGLGVVLVDYLTAEGVANTCRGEIAHERVGEYIATALEFARTLPRVDSTRLYVVGWSHGGAGVLSWLGALGESPTPAARAVAVYPSCGSKTPWASDMPILMLLGDADDITPPEECDELTQRLPDSARVQVRHYADARHGFDMTEGPEVLQLAEGITIGRNERAGEEAWRELFAFLADH